MFDAQNYCNEPPWHLVFFICPVSNDRQRFSTTLNKSGTMLVSRHKKCDV
jgi:hypothetical protein